jgi:mono/diheme cytochrome c family protein
MKKLITIGSFLLLITVIISCNEQDIEFNRYYAAGATVYQTHCQNCHGDKGQGLAALIPPLTDSVYLKANKHLLACYLQNGLKGKINIHGKEFEGEMPATVLSPKEMAQVLTYVTNSFGNQLGIIDNETVEKDLKGCK